MRSGPSSPSRPEQGRRRGTRLALQCTPYGGSSGFCTVTGEPFHDILNLRKAASPAKNDYWDLVRDHMDMIGRLSAAEKPPGQREPAGAPELAMVAHQLLLTAVSQPRHVVLRAVDSSHAATAESRRFRKMRR